MVSGVITWRSSLRIKFRWWTSSRLQWRYWIGIPGCSFGSDRNSISSSWIMIWCRSSYRIIIWGRWRRVRNPRRSPRRRVSKSKDHKMMSMITIMTIFCGCVGLLNAWLKVISWIVQSRGNRIGRSCQHTGINKIYVWLEYYRLYNLASWWARRSTSQSFLSFWVRIPPNDESQGRCED